MNVLMESTTATKTQHATIMLDHLVAPAVPGYPEMEPIVKVCSISLNFSQQIVI